MSGNFDLFGCMVMSADMLDEGLVLTQIFANTVELGLTKSFGNKLLSGRPLNEVH